jgi:hypothetical protein
MQAACGTCSRRIAALAICTPRHSSAFPCRIPKGERKVLSDAVAAAVAISYRAKKTYDSAKAKRTADVDELAAALAAARKTELEAPRALQDHFREHGCAIDQTK